MPEEITPETVMGMVGVVPTEAEAATVEAAATAIV